ncbi:hypothetical protein [Caballeronia sp. Lep1P3]|uniref:hypothetical protein n=1 Tax=Caballeronia sp. Lep1P3 TaxID=2878150 RepID=UPI001FD556D0|nr:hypothetical protein [Caballeronia sp. Lep1P3]
MERTVALALLALAIVQTQAQAACNQNPPSSGSRQMSKQYIRDSQSHVIGSIDTLPDGRQRAYDAHFRTVGTCDCRADRAHDSGFRSVGDGNQLVGLIWQAAGK